MRGNQEDTSAFNTHFQSGRFSHSRKVLTSDVFITVNGSLVNFFNPNGVDRNAYLPELEEGRFFVVSNVGVANLVVVRDSLGVLKTSLLPGDTALLFASKSEWVALRGWAALAVFTNTVNGLVPAPNSVTPGSLFLRDDGQWGQIQVTGIVDAFKFITDGTNIAIGSGPDTFWLRSSTNKIGITVTNNEAIFGDNANFTVLEANVDHNDLLNYVADQHVAHSGVTLTAGLGISGGGDITTSRTFDFAPSKLTVNAAPVLTDYCVMDLAAGGPRRTLFSVVNGILNHNALLNYVADQHIAHSGVSIVAGVGLTGGGDITTSRTLALNINGLTADTLAVGDFFAFFDISGSDHNKVTLANLNSSLDHNSLLNYVADQHIAHSGVSITGTGMLSGGGAITTSSTLNLASVAANTVLGSIAGGVPIALTAAQLTTIVNAFTTTLKGLVPPPATVTNKFLRDDGTWAAPTGSGTVTNVATAGLASGGPITTTGTVTVTAASKSDQQTGSSSTVAVTPSQAQSHDSAAKAWCRVTQSAGTYTVQASYNVTSVTKNSTGNLTVNFTTAFATANFAAIVGTETGVLPATNTYATGSVVVVLRLATAPGTPIDANFDITCFGRQ